MENNILDLLLSKEATLPKKKLNMPRLSEELGADVTFEIKGLKYQQVVDFIRGSEESEINIVMEGLVSPDIKDNRLLQKFGAITPEELLKDSRFLRPGEVLALSNEISKLSGFYEKQFEDIEKNSITPSTDR